MRRFLMLLLVTPVLSLPARAADPLAPDASQPHRTRQTLEQHFAQANVAHDGHLTLEQAKGGYPLVAKNFEDIDADHKGYVTEQDIRDWRTMRKTAHRLSQKSDDKLRPRAAFQPGCPDLRAISTSAPQIVATPTTSASGDHAATPSPLAPSGEHVIESPADASSALQ